MLRDLIAKLYDMSVGKRQRSGGPRLLLTQNVGLRSSKLICVYGGNDRNDNY